jgi:hypothetical protein
VSGVASTPRSGAAPRATLRVALSLLLGVALQGCAALTRSATTSFAESLTTAILDQDDVETVRDGAPAYLLAVDGLIEGDPRSTALLLTGARLYGSYASAFVVDDARRRRLWNRSFGYARRALCRDLSRTCATLEGPAEPFVESLADAEASDVPVLFGLGTAWAGWVQAHADDWAAVAEIPKIEALMERVLALDETYERGGAHLYLGVLFTQRPASLGGRPEEGREHFERAIALSGGRDLMAKVLYAQQYARLVFDQPLHDRLLGEVLAADPQAPGMTLGNTVAQEQAARLLDESDEYF